MPEAFDGRTLILCDPATKARYLDARRSKSSPRRNFTPGLFEVIRGDVTGSTFWTASSAFLGLL